jgi:intraflagellar transport protein 122
MLCYSCEKSMFVVSGVSCNETGERKQQSHDDAQEQHLAGVAIGFAGQKIYCLYNNNMVGLDVPQGGNMTKLLDKEDYEAAYRVACLGATESDWRILATRSLRANQLTIAKSAFARLKESKYLHLIDSIERDVGDAVAAGPVAGASAAQDSTVGRRGRGAATTKPAPVASSKSKNALEPTWQAELLAYQGHHNEAAKVYARAGKLEEAIRLFTDMRMWNEAKMFAQSMDASKGAFDHNALVQQQAKWLEEIRDWKGATEIYCSMGRFMQAAKIISDAVPEAGWQSALIDVVRATPADMREVLSFCGEVLSQYNEDVLAREAYAKLGDVNKLMSLFVKRQMWVEAAKLADENEGKFDSAVFLPYAEWLIMQDRCEDAIQAYKKAGRQDLARKILEELTLNAVVETRFKDAAYYYWLLSKDMCDGTDTNYQLECEHNADLYYAYSSVHSYVTDPFTSQSPELLFQVSRFIINSLGSSDSIPYGISKAATLYTLARQSMVLDSFKLARHAYDRLNKLQIPVRWQDEIEHDMLIVQAKPVRDSPDQLPSCYRCSSTNPLLNPFTNKFAKGDVCTNCGHPFVRSFINFDILPLVEFVPEPSISDEEAIELIRTNASAGRSPRTGKGKAGGWNEGKMGDADAMTFDSMDSNGDDLMGGGGGHSEELFANCLNRALENQVSELLYRKYCTALSNLLLADECHVIHSRHGGYGHTAAGYEAIGGVRVQAVLFRQASYILQVSGDPNTVLVCDVTCVCRNMLPEVVAIAISQSCHRFFHLEDFEFSYLSNKSCPFSRLKDVGEYGSL